MKTPISTVVAALALLSANAFAVDNSYYVTDGSTTHPFYIYNDGRNTYVEAVPGLIVSGATADGQRLIINGVPSEIKAQLDSKNITIFRGTAPRKTPQSNKEVLARIEDLSAKISSIEKYTDSSKSKLIQENLPIEAKPLPEKKQIVEISENSIPLTKPSSSPEKKGAETNDVALNAKQWAIETSDKSIRSLLERWCKEANYQLMWEIPVDLQIGTTAQISGSFHDALNSLLASLNTSDYPVEALIYENRVIRIVKHAQRGQVQ
jgi:hypothetical protein